MSAAWPIVQLGQCCHRVTDGTHQSPKFESRGIPFLVIGDIVSGEIDWPGVSKWVSRDTYEANTARCRPERGDVLYTAVGSFGVAVPVETDREFMFQRHIAHIKPDQTRVDSRFLANMLNSPTIRRVADRVAKGVAQRTVTLGDLKCFEIPLPPLPEQKRIAAILDKADEIRKKRTEAIKLTEALLRSAFLEMCGQFLQPGGCQPLKDVCQVLVDCRNKTAPYENEGIPLIRTTNFRNNALDLASVKYVSEATNKTWSSRHQTSPGDVVYCREAPFGMAAIVPENFFPCLGQRIMVARPNHKVVTTNFLWAALNSPFVFDQAKRVAVGATVQHLRVRDVEGLEIPVPPLRLQEKFSRFADSLTSLSSTYSEAALGLEKASASLTQRAFRGEL